MADFLTETQIGEIQNAYNAIDTDADGIIATSDLGSLLRLLGQNPTDAELQVRNLIHLKYISHRIALIKQVLTGSAICF